MIYRFLEDPMILLSTIKDDDHLTAYKIPKVLKKTKFLQLIHRREEQYVHVIKILEIMILPSFIELLFC